MKLVAVVSVLAFIVCSQVIMSNFVVAGNRLPFHISPQSFEQSAEYITITGELHMQSCLENIA